MAAPNTIVLQGKLSESHEERFAGAAGIMPGDCLMVDAGNEYVVQATAGGAHRVIVAKEDDLQGKTIDDAYADAVPVFGHAARPGDKVYVRLTTSQTITIDEMLEYDGTGKVRVLAAGVAKFQAAEAVTTTGAAARIAAWVI